MTLSLTHREAGVVMENEAMASHALQRLHLVLRGQRRWLQ